MASFPPGSCCYQGVRHEGTSRGKLIQLDKLNVEAYVVSPENQETDKGIVM